MLAGGTDVYPQHVGRTLTPPVIDIGGLAELRGVERTGDGYRIGALTRWADVATADLPGCFDGLRAAARQVGSVQVQNAATVGGNLCNASPAADGIPPLLTLDASVELTSTAGRRVVPLDAFLTGYRQTALRPDELLTAVLVPSGRRGCAVRVLEARAPPLPGDLGRDGGGVSWWSMRRVSWWTPGWRSGRARRWRSVSARSSRSWWAGRLRRSIAPAISAHLSSLSPIDDVRATADYRRAAAAVLVSRALASLGGDG